MAYTQADLDSIKKSIASGVAECNINGRLMKFRSLAEMNEIKRAIEADVSTSVRPKSRFVRPGFDKGYQ